jgi:tRNA 5-methylaminomethyl-2-thiouridine biosynthesis bifunctional protein
MKRDNHPFTALKSPLLEWKDGATPYSANFSDIYFSSDDGLQESQQTFLQGNQLPERWHGFEKPRFHIAETGFGTGLNFLLTLQAWLEIDAPKPDLHYLSVENCPLTRGDLEKALGNWSTLSQLSKQLMASYPPPFPGTHRLEFESGRVILDLHWGEANTVLKDLAEAGQTQIDAWYLDGFAPSRNSDMWSDELLGLTSFLSRENASFATFTAAGSVRRALTSAGFKTHKVPGFGRKREALRGSFTQASSDPPAATKTPWDLASDNRKRPSSVIVIGAGLAGCWTARALANRGIAVTLLDKNTLASSGSGNKQGILYTRISHHHSLLVDFGLHSYLYASRLYAALFESGALIPGKDGELCGGFQTFNSAKEKERLAGTFTELCGVAEYLDAGTASKRLGIELHRDGYWLADSGWLHPQAVCRALIENEPLIELREHCGELSLSHTGDTWQASDGEGEIIASANCAVIAAGTGSTAFSQADYLPLRAIRGQTSDLPVTQASSKLHAVLCHEGYIAPARDGVHCVGASFNLDNHSNALETGDHRDNLAKLASAVPSWKSALQEVNCDTLAGNVGFRCASPDYLPTVGRLPKVNTFLQDYAALSDNAKQLINTRGSYLEGLYVTAGHGSRGLTSTPISAEILAGLICDEPLPLERDICRALSPARFLIRDLMRARKQK